jgi:Double-GTPase 1
MSGHFHSILGLPGSGKTTYLAALWHLIDAGEADTKLVLDRLVGNQAYLNRIVEAWRRCEEVPRTSMGAEEKSLSIHVHERGTGTKAVLAFPDLSGESFERQFADRACTQEYAEAFSREGGIVLFVNADRPSDGMTLLDIRPAVAGDEAPQPQEQQPAGEHAKPSAQDQKMFAEPWSPSCVPEQVRLVDILQFLQRPPFHRWRRRLCVVVSAWDVVGSAPLQPSEWLAREMPLLDQFLKNNPDSFEVRVYGVSAQGGKVKGASRTELLKVQQPSLRIRCVGPNTTPHDLTAPLVWLSGGD